MIDERKIRMLARIALLSGAAASFSACAPLALTTYGVGAATAVSHSLGGITYRTFTAPARQVKTASLGALNHMGIKLASTEKVSGGDVLRATASDREIEIRLEPISPNTTRMRVIARNGSIFYDSATATEIILQTERQLVKA